MKLLILAIIIFLAVISCNHYSGKPVITYAVSENIEWLHDYARCMNYGMEITSMYGSGPARTDIICAPVRHEHLVLEIKNSYSDKDECITNMRRFFYNYGYSVGITSGSAKSNNVFASRICDGRTYYHSESSFIPSQVINSYSNKNNDDIMIAPSNVVPGAPPIGGGLSIVP